MENDGVVDDIDALEEGEYIPLERVTNVTSQMCIGKSIADPTDDDLDSPSYSESDTDSDSDNQFRAKKPKVKKSIKPLPKVETKAKKYNIWANVQEDTLTETLGGCGVSQTFDKSRDVESYDYRLGFAESQKAVKKASSNSFNRRFRRFSSESADGNTTRKLSSDGDSNDGLFSRQRSFSDCKRNEKTFKRTVNKRKIKDRSNIHLRLGRRPSTNDENSSDSKFDVHNILDLNITVEDADEDVACAIANKLYESKDSLISRSVKILGKEKAIELFYETQRIENEGGMTTMDGVRRRTPGGIYLFLIKHGDEIPESRKKEIFQEERKCSNTRKKKLNQRRRKDRIHQFQEIMKKADKDLPTLLSQPEASAQLLSASSKRKNELDRNIDNVVTNPPPSPVTDGGRENSSDMDTHQISVDKSETVVNQEKLTNIEEQSADFLDLSYGDAMDLF